MKLTVHIHGQIVGVLNDTSKLNRWMTAIKRTHGTFKFMGLDSGIHK